jgi:3-dehydroquinate dehydratase/shikimate dehydrogenase
MPWNPAKYCVSLLPSSKEELWQHLPDCNVADVIEIRLDHLGASANLLRVRKLVSKPLIVTVRSKVHGGFWEGTEKERLDVFRQAIAAGADYIDLEWKSTHMLTELKSNTKTGIILSHHSPENNLSQLTSVFKEMLKTPVDIYKLIYTAHSLNDNLLSLPLIELARQNAVNYIIHGMGQEGRLSRIMGALRGNFFNYVSQEVKSSTAEGQLTLEEARNTFFLHEKSAHTRLIGLLGFPIKQSYGWQLHNRMLHLKRKTIETDSKSFTDFIYVNFPVARFEDFWSHWPDHVDGISITIPYKERIVPQLHYKGKTVELSGVCNTALKRHGKWYGFNTDMMAIYDLIYPWQDLVKEMVLVYGTGATARSVLAALRELQASRVYLSGRNSSKGMEVTDYFGAEYIPENEISSIQPAVLIHTTPLGMYPNVREIPPLTHSLEKARLVFDVVYNPPETGLLKLAREKGCRIISGVDMYLQQAARQFQLFSGLSLNLRELTSLWNEITGRTDDNLS